MRAYVPAYSILSPLTLAHALQLLADEPSLRPLAGGTDIMVLLESGDLPPGRFLDISRLTELQGIVVTDRAITIGALATFTEIRRQPVLRAEYPLLCEAARMTGAIAIQNRGTLGGNIANASPAADSPPALLVYEAELELISTQGTRRVPYRSFHTGYKKMDRRPGELVRAIHLQRPPCGPGAFHFYRKVGTRGAQAISKVVFAGLARMEHGKVADCRIALGSVAPVILRCPRTERTIVGKAPTAETIERARAEIMAEISPIDDIRSTRKYRSKVTGNLVAQFLSELAAR